MSFTSNVLCYSNLSLILNIEILLVKSNIIFRKLFSTKSVLLILILAVTLIKLSLSGSGFLALQDERRYEKSAKAIQCLTNYNIKGFFFEIFSTKGRPGETIVKIIPNSIQFITAKIFTLNVYETENSYPLFFFNFIVYCLTLVLHYKCSRLLLKNDSLSLLSVLIYSCFINPYLYLRHAVPYDSSLLILYFCFYKALVYQEEKNTGGIQYFKLGILTTFGYLVYPGFFPLVFLTGLMILLYKQHDEGYFKRFKKLLLLIVGGLFLIVFFELLSNIGGKSFLNTTRELSSTINQGSFEETLVFLFKYLFEVEQLNGILVFAGLFFFLISLFKRREEFFFEPVLLTVGILTFIYTLYGCAGFLFHKVVYYGRLMHQYYPFICIAILYPLANKAFKLKTRTWLLLVISLTFVVSFFYYFLEYKRYDYPRDIGWKYLNIHGRKFLNSKCEYGGGESQIPSGAERMKKSKNVDKKTASFLFYNIINGCYHDRFDRLKMQDISYIVNYGTLLESQTPFYCFKGYQYEGYSIPERKTIDSLNVKIKVYGLNFHY